MSHYTSMFTNSCVRVPRDPKTKMPKTTYEYKAKTLIEQSSIDSASTVSGVAPDLEAERLKDFYRSIPDYKDIHHLTPDEFYSTLRLLREKKNKMLGHAVINIDEDFTYCKRSNEDLRPQSKMSYTASLQFDKKGSKLGNKYLAQSTSNILSSGKENYNTSNISHNLLTSKEVAFDDIAKNDELNNTEIDNKDVLQPVNTKLNKVQDVPLDKDESKPKRNYSACSITWDDSCKVDKDEVDNKFDNFFEGKSYDMTFDNKSRSMPTSPIRGRRTLSPSLRRGKSITIPKPFKMTERDEDQTIAGRLKHLQKSLSDDMLHKKFERKLFRARPVPIESRIPLYQKILEDQAMRRAITKINSEAELRARMKPFSFTKREENGSRATSASCERAAQIIPKKKKKRFRAKPVPKNLFSNYVYDKMREDEFFRSLNRRIRAEEMLRKSALPNSMMARDSRLSTPGAHSDLPTDPSPVAPSATPSDRPRTRSPTKEKRRERNALRHQFITTSPQPFTFNTADRAAKKMMEVTKKIYQSGGKSSTSGIESGPGVPTALELQEHCTGRSNLAALLRVENVKRRFDIEATRRMTEQQRRVELKTRDRLLRSKPAWHLVKNNHEEDIAMRLQTRRDEERMRREEFLHEMELMYGRVRQQPLLFERYYAPRSLSAPSDQYSTRRIGKRQSRKSNNHYNTPNHSRKVSINEIPETFNGVMMSDYLDRIANNKVYSDSVVTDSLDGIK